MAELKALDIQRAAERAAAPLAPAIGEGDHQDITTSRRFGPFVPGDFVTISVTAEARIRTGDSAVTAAAANTPIPAGWTSVVIPTGVTHVAVFSAAAGALGTAWKS